MDYKSFLDACKTQLDKSILDIANISKEQMLTLAKNSDLQCCNPVLVNQAVIDLREYKSRRDIDVHFAQIKKIFEVEFPKVDYAYDIKDKILIIHLLGKFDGASILQ